MFSVSILLLDDTLYCVVTEVRFSIVACFFFWLF